MAYVCLLGHVQILKLWNHVGYYHLFCFTLTLVQNLLLIRETNESPALQKYDVIKRNETESNFETELL